MSPQDVLEAAVVALLGVGLLASAVASFDRMTPRPWVQSRHDFALAALWLVPLAFGFALQSTPAPLFGPETAPSTVLAPVDAHSPPATISVPKARPTEQSSLGDPAGATGAAVLLIVWAVGSLGLAVRLGIDMLRLRTVWRRRRAAHLAVELSIPLRVHRASAIRSPVYIGYGHRTIAVPEDFEVNGETRLLLEHEVAHAKRHDDWSELISRTVLVVFWWAVPAYFLYGIVRRNREILCDLRAAEVTGAPRQLARALIDAAARSVRPPALTLAAQPSRAMLSARVQHLIDASQTARRSKGTLMRLSITLPLLAVGVFVGTPRVVAQSNPPAAELRPAPTSLPPRAIDEALFRVAGDGDLMRIESLLADGANVNAALSGDGSPLIAAARHGHLQAVDLLLDRGANPNLGVLSDGTPLIAASANGHHAVIRRLVRAGAHLDAGLPRDGNPLIAAALRGRVSTVELLLSLGADPNAYVYGDETPMVNAAQAGHVPVAEALLKAGANLSLTVKTPSASGTDIFRSPLSEAERNGHAPMVEWLKARGAEHRPTP